MNILSLKSKRFNRSTYVLSMFISMFVFVAAGLFLSFILTLFIGSADPNNTDSPHPIVFIPFLVLWFVYYGFCIAKRFHDMDVHGAWTIAAFVPYIGAILGFILFFIPGSKGENDYGDQPTRTFIMGFPITRDK